MQLEATRFVVNITRIENKNVQSGSAMRHSGRYQITPPAMITPMLWIISPNKKKIDKTTEKETSITNDMDNGSLNVKI